MIGIKSGHRENTGLQCPQAKQLFSPYLDGAVTGTEMLALQSIWQSAWLQRQYESLRRTQKLLTSVARPKVPADLGVEAAAGDFA